MGVLLHRSITPSFPSLARPGCPLGLDGGLQRLVDLHLDRRLGLLLLGAVAGRDALRLGEVRADCLGRESVERVCASQRIKRHPVSRFASRRLALHFEDRVNAQASTALTVMVLLLRIQEAGEKLVSIT